MYAKLQSATVYGIDGIIVEVEVDIHNGLPGWGTSTSPAGIWPPSEKRSDLRRRRSSECGSVRGM